VRLGPLSAAAAVHAAIKVGEHAIHNGVDDLEESATPRRWLTQLVADLDGDRHVRAMLVAPACTVIARSTPSASGDAAPAWFYRMLVRPPEVAGVDLPARYVLPKIIAGVPNDHVMAPDENVLVAGISQSQHFLSAVAEGRIVTRPAIGRFEGRTVHFTDGITQEADAVLLGTGYLISLRCWSSRHAGSPTRSRADLRRALLSGPLSPVSFHLEAPDSLADTPARVAAEAAAFGYLDPSLTQPDAQPLTGANAVRT
jgi:hypothetical protein